MATVTALQSNLNKHVHLAQPLERVADDEAST